MNTNELIKIMRHCSDGEKSCLSCPQYLKHADAAGTSECVNNLLSAAASVLKRQQERIKENVYET